MTDATGFGLVVTVSADTWALSQRRLAFLEAVLSQLLQDRAQIREWFTARELATLSLPSLSDSPASIAALAHHRAWATRIVQRNGKSITAYHFTSLPQAAFEAFIRRIVTLPDDEDLIPEFEPIKPISDSEQQWFLPLMRIIKGGRAKNWQEAYSNLITVLPKGVKVPAQEDIRQAYLRLRKVK